jgi:NAD-dependent deacetylase
MARNSASFVTFEEIFADLDEAAPRRNNDAMPDAEAELLRAIDEARGLLDTAEHVAVLTGAGLSTDSGIPDFRGPQGLWTRNPAAEKMATIQNYMAEPDVRVRSWQHKLAMADQANRPNAGHRALLALEDPDRLHTLITQNVDGLHHDAGQDPDRIVEIHGTMRAVTCMACHERQPMEPVLRRVLAGEEDPACRTCGGILKSATISFGQGLVAEDLERAELAARACDVMLAVGSTLSVYPIAAVVPIAAECGASVIIVNGEATEMDRIADVVIRGSISDVLPQILPANDAA